MKPCEICIGNVSSSNITLKIEHDLGHIDEIWVCPEHGYKIEKASNSKPDQRHKINSLLLAIHEEHLKRREDLIREYIWKLFDIFDGRELCEVCNMFTKRGLTEVEGFGETVKVCKHCLNHDQESEDLSGKNEL